MRINSITNTLFIGNKAKQNQNLEKRYNDDTYVTKNIDQNFGPSFGINWFGLGKKAVAKTADAATLTEAVKVKKGLSPAKQITKRFDAMIEENEISREWSCVDSSLKRLEESVNEETLPFVNGLVDLLSAYEIKSNLTYNVDQITSLASKFKQYPQGRAIMQEAFDKQAKNKDSLSLFRLNETFSFNYNASDIQNRFIHKLLNLNGFGGNPRFNGFSTFSTFEHLSTPEHEEALNLILHKTVVNDAHTSVKKLAKVIKESPAEDFTKNKDGAVIQGKKKFLINSEHEISSVLEYVTPETLPVLKTILPRVNDSDEIVAVLKNYKPTKQAFLEKGLKLVDNGDLSLYKLGQSLKYAGKN